MAKITFTLCDVKPCNRMADRDFQLNGKTIHVCGEGCYVKYWSREYQRWKKLPYELQVNQRATEQAQSFPLMLNMVGTNS
jgi:hypothetical protein